MELERKATTGASTEQIPETGRYAEFFPQKFDFYGLGRVELSKKGCLAAECASAPLIVAFQVSGDEQGLCTVAFENATGYNAESSMHLELANVLASKFITQLADAGCADVTLSPPNLLESGDSRHRLLASTLLAAGSRDAFARRYVFMGEGAPSIVMRLAYLPSQRGGRS